jgi:protein-S-isoprenylcysteine O-methyltransferase Ste14
VAFWAIFGLFILGELAVRVRSSRNRGGRRAEGWSLIVVVVCAVGGVLAAFRLANWSGGAVGAARWPLFFAGLGLMVTGIVVRQWAVLTLGRFFTVDVRVQPDQTVVDRCSRTSATTTAASPPGAPVSFPVSGRRQ